MSFYPMQPGVPAMGHIAGGYWHPGPLANCHRGPCRARNAHDYEPGEVTHPMHSDPLCCVCGLPRKTREHR